MAEVNLPRYNNQKDYQFMDVYENLALLMIVRKEVKDYIRRCRDKLLTVERVKTLMQEQPMVGVDRQKSKASRKDGWVTNNNNNQLRRSVTASKINLTVKENSTRKNNRDEQVKRSTTINSNNNSNAPRMLRDLARVMENTRS